MPALLDGLCSTDPDLRDSLSYELLATWVQRGHFSPVECRAMLPHLLANLRMGLGEGENDLVFGRTFSALILGEIIAYDGKAGFLTQAELEQILEAGLHYLAEEQDLRGYVPDSGWAHSAAHTADLLLALVRHPGLGVAEMARLLDGIAQKVLAPTRYPFVDSEGFRLARPVIAMLEREALLTALHLMITYREVPESARTEVLPAVHRALKSFIPWFL